MDQLVPWSGLGGFLLVVVPIGLLLVMVMIYSELKMVKRALWALVSQLKATRSDLHAAHVDAVHHKEAPSVVHAGEVKQSMFGR